MYTGPGLSGKVPHGGRNQPLSRACVFCQALKADETLWFRRSPSPEGKFTPLKNLAVPDKRTQFTLVTKDTSAMIANGARKCQAFSTPRLVCFILFFRRLERLFVNFYSYFFRLTIFWAKNSSVKIHRMKFFDENFAIAF